MSAEPVIRSNPPPDAKPKKAKRRKWFSLTTVVGDTAIEMVTTEGEGHNTRVVERRLVVPMNARQIQLGKLMQHLVSDGGDK